jgi:hypothetical protein
MIKNLRDWLQISFERLFAPPTTDGAGPSDADKAATVSSNLKDKYYAEFGEFMDRFASVETLIHIFFRRLTGMDSATARTISEGMTLAQLMTAIRRIVVVQNRDQEMIQSVEATFAQLSAIAAFRNFLVHRGVELEGDAFVVHDQMTSRSLEHYKRLDFNVHDLRAASSDCNVIFLKVRRIFAPVPPEEEDPFALQVMAEPWRYTPRAAVKTEWA